MQKHDNTGQKESVKKYFVSALNSEKNLFFLDSLEEFNQQKSLQCL